MAFQIVAWLIALGWVTSTVGAARGLPKIPNVLLPEYDIQPEGLPSITVIVPARNEEADIAATLTSLLAQDYPNLSVIAVDDRSSDATGSIMEEQAAVHSLRLRVLHVQALPGGWLGKTHAMAIAADLAIAKTAEYLLFTDGDIFFRADAIRRAVAAAMESKADHFVVFPTTISRRWDEAPLLGVFQIMGLWATRPWLASQSTSQRDAVGIGAFNMLRASAYRQVGGFESLRMEIVEDLALARRVKSAGLVQRAAFGRDLVRVHWAAGAPGLVRVLTKNMFAAFHFNVALLLLGCALLVLTFVAPFVMLFVSGYRIPSAIVIVTILAAFRVMSPLSGIAPWNAALSPFAALTMVYAQMRSMVVTLRQGGVVWRGTFYSLAELRRNAAPLFPRRR